MAQLERTPEEEMMQQKEIFESKEVDKVQKKDSGLSLRRCNNTPVTPCKPTLNSLLATKGGPPAMTTAWPGGNCELALGTPASPGMSMEGVVNVPANCTGTLEMVQLINRNLKKKDTANNEQCIKTGGYVLDSSDPYPNATKRITTAGRNTLKTSDSPGGGFANGNKHHTASDQFKMYLLWTPDRPSGSPRVALGMVTWSWAAKTNKTGTTGGCSADWTVSDQSSTGGTGAATNQLPTWTKTYPSDFPYSAC